MTIERIPITSRDQWLARRKFDITASSIGAVFGCHQYTTPLRLFTEKQGLVKLPEVDGTALRRGRILEAAVPGAVVEERPEWRIEKATDYFSDPVIGIGATPDFFITNDPRGLGVLQAKTTVPSVYDQHWQNGRPPRWVELQVATEMMLTDAAFGVVACLVIDPFDLPCIIVEQTRDPVLEQQIREQVVKFWQDVHDGNEPDTDYGLDRDLLKQLFPKETTEGPVNLADDDEAVAGLGERRDLKEQIKRAEERCRQIETLIMDRMQTAAYATAPGFSITWKVQHRKEHVVPASSPRVLNIRSKRAT